MKLRGADGSVDDVTTGSAEPGAWGWSPEARSLVETPTEYGAAVFNGAVVWSPYAH